MSNWQDEPASRRRKAVEVELVQVFEGNYGNSTLPRLSSLLTYVSNSPGVSLPLTRIAVEAPDLTVHQIHHAIELLNGAHGRFGWFSKTPDRKFLTWVPEGGVSLPNPANTMPAREHRSRRGDVTKLVLEYAHSRPGIMFTLAEVAEATGLTEKQCQTMISDFEDRNPTGGRFEVNVRGNAWTYFPPKPEAERDGKWQLIEIVLEDGDQQLYRTEAGEYRVSKPHRLF